MRPGFFSIFIFFILLYQLQANIDFVERVVKSPYSVRASGMGSAFTAVGQGAGSIGFNPAGLARPGRLVVIEKYDLDNTLTQELSSEVYYLLPISLSRYREKALNEDWVEVFTYGYGKQGKKSVDWGVTYKSIKGRVPEAISGWTSDLGLLAHLAPNLKLGLVFQDIFQSAVVVPKTFRAGLAILSPGKDFIVAVDLVQKKEGEESIFYVHQGLEWLVDDALVIRGGYFQGKVTGGASLRIPLPVVKYIHYGVITDQQTKETYYMFSLQVGKGLFSE